MVFLAANSLLSYFHFPLQVKIILGLLGVVLPLYVALRNTPLSSRNEKPPYLQELNLPLPLWLWVPGLFLVFFLRFYRFESLFDWPNLDEGWIGTIALELSRHWSWKFFYTFGEAPPLTIWCVAVLLKLGFTPAVSLWFPPALCSVSTVFLGYFAARQFFSKSFSLLCGGLLAFSYWPLLLGRLCHQGIWLPLWVCLCVLLLGGFQKAKDEKAKKVWALGLGFGLGVGSFIFTPWPVVTGLCWLGLLWNWALRPGKNRPFFILCTLSLALSLAPFCLALAREGYGTHLLSLSPWGGWFNLSHAFTNFLSYFTVFFWGVFDPEPAYTPVWGGFLNPLLASCFFGGLLELYRFRKLSIPQWVMGAFLLFLLPGALSLNVETFRVAPVLPLVIFIAALGFHSLLETLPGPRRLRWLVLFLALSGSLDFYLLVSPFQNPDAYPEDFGRPVRSLERYRAYEILDGLRKTGGPLLVLANFETDSFNDPTLPLMAYPFNAAGNEDLLRGMVQAQHPPQWLAVFVNSHYEPFLQKRFPGGKWFPVSKDLPSADGGDLLGVIPVTAADYPAFLAWVGADKIFEEADRQRFLQSPGDVQPSIQTLDRARSLVGGDLFLQSLYWDKRAAYEYVALNYDQQLYSYQMAVKEGYPTADLYFKLGELLRVRGRLAEAREAYLKATQAPLDLTPSSQILAGLKAQPPSEAAGAAPKR
ncbi:MAG TPA: glycosyltransferase family 39 protein [bacterium]|nr:glycosyltransferase family 39 protein [bacterium]